MKRIITPLFLLSISMLCYSLDVVFGYDAAGNRTTATVVLPAQTRSSSSEPEEPVRQPLGNRSLSVYPNPTKGTLYIRLNGNPEAQSSSSVPQKLEARLFDLKGLLLQEKQSASTELYLNLESYASGSYLLVVSYGEERTDFKVVKE